MESEAKQVSNILAERSALWIRSMHGTTSQGDTPLRIAHLNRHPRTVYPPKFQLVEAVPYATTVVHSSWHNWSASSSTVTKILQRRPLNWRGTCQHSEWTKNPPLRGLYAPFEPVASQTTKRTIWAVRSLFPLMASDSTPCHVGKRSGHPEGVSQIPTVQTGTKHGGVR